MKNIIIIIIILSMLSQATPQDYVCWAGIAKQALRPVSAKLASAGDELSIEGNAEIDSYFQDILNAILKGRFGLSIMSDEIWLLSGMRPLLEPLLRAATSDKDPKRRQRAIAALGRLGFVDERVKDAMRKHPEAGKSAYTRENIELAIAMNEKAAALRYVERVTGEQSNLITQRYIDLDEINLSTFLELYLSILIPTATDVERIVALAEGMHGDKKGLPVIVEVGPGKGLLAYLLAKTGRVRVVGLDFGHNVRLIRFSHPNLSFQAVRSDKYIMEYGDGADVVLCSFMSLNKNLTPVIRNMNAPCIVYARDHPWGRVGFTPARAQELERHQDLWPPRKWEFSFEPGENYHSGFNWLGCSLWNIHSEAGIKDTAKYLVQFRNDVIWEGPGLLSVRADYVYPFERGLRQIIKQPYHESTTDADSPTTPKTLQAIDSSV